MKKYEGELHDFIPGTSGYAAYWVQSKFSIYCEKTKMKMKLGKVERETEKQK